MDHDKHHADVNNLEVMTLRRVSTSELSVVTSPLYRNSEQSLEQSQVIDLVLQVHALCDLKNQVHGRNMVCRKLKYEVLGSERR